MFSLFRIQEPPPPLPAPLLSFPQYTPLCSKNNEPTDGVRNYEGARDMFIHTLYQLTPSIRYLCVLIRAQEKV